MSRFERCPQCGDFGWLESKVQPIHKCLPVWRSRMDHQDDTEWRDVHAYDAEHAATKFAEQHDSDEGDYPIMRNGDRGGIIVLVRKPNAAIERFSIRAESVPAYYASKLEDEDAP